MGAQISSLVELCAHLNGERAKAIRRHSALTTVRVEAGDKALHSVIDQNCDRVDRAAALGDSLAVILQGTRTAPVEDVHWAADWNAKRAIQKVSNKDVIDVCRDQRINAPNIQNLLNQAPLGGAVQAGPMKPTLKAPGTKRLKLKIDAPLSELAFKLNLRRYFWGLLHLQDASKTKTESPSPRPLRIT